MLSDSDGWAGLVLGPCVYDVHNIGSRAMTRQRKCTKRLGPGGSLGVGVAREFFRGGRRDEETTARQVSGRLETLASLAYMVSVL